MFDFSTWTNMIKGTAETAGKKAGEVLEVTKVKMQIAQQRAELSKAYEKLGAMVYDMMKNEAEDSSAVDVCIDEIDFILSKIHDAESKVNDLKKVTLCAACGAEIAMDACFCSRCGAKVERPEPVAEPAEEETVVSEEIPAEGEESCCEEFAEAGSCCCSCEKAPAPAEEEAAPAEDSCCEASAECCEEKKEQPEA